MENSGSIQTATNRRSRIDYCAEIERLIRGNREKAALGVIDDGLRAHPNDPLLSSYYGRTIAVAQKEREEGVRVCRDAVELMRKTDPSGYREYGGTLYLNLGKACLAARSGKSAIEAFREGLRESPGHPQLIWELKKLGTRQTPPLPFLHRDNFFNRHLGKLVHRLKRRPSRLD